MRPWTCVRPAEHQRIFKSAGAAGWDDCVQKSSLRTKEAESSPSNKVSDVPAPTPSGFQEGELSTVGGGLGVVLRPLLPPAISTEHGPLWWASLLIWRGCGEESRVGGDVSRTFLTAPQRKWPRGGQETPLVGGGERLWIPASSSGSPPEGADGIKSALRCRICCLPEEKKREKKKMRIYLRGKQQEAELRVRPHPHPEGRGGARSTLTDTEIAQVDIQHRL